MLAPMVVVFLVFIALIAAQEPVPAPQTWECFVASSKPLMSSGSIVWSVQNCTNTPGQPALLKVNSVLIDLLATDIRVVPGVSMDPANPLKTLPEMVVSNPDKQYLAGGKLLLISCLFNFIIIINIEIT